MDEQQVKRLVDALRGGADIETASAFAGIPLAQVSELVARGQMEHERIEAGLAPDEGNASALSLWRETYKARADAVVRAIAQIQKAAQQGDWKAAAWWLERVMPETYQPKQEKRLNGDTVVYGCSSGHQVTLSRRLDDAEAVKVCGICGQSLTRM